MSDGQRLARDVFERLSSGEQGKPVVMRNNEMATVMLPASQYEALLEDLADLRIEAIARDRQASFDDKTAISHETCCPA